MALRAAGKAAGWTLGATAVVTGVSATYLAHEFGPEVLSRIIRVYKEAIPATIDYKGLQFCEEHAPSLVGVVTAKSYEELHDKWAHRLLAATFDLRGFFLKGGQLVASNYGNAFPPLYQKIFAPVLDKQPHMEWEETKGILLQELKAAGYSSIEDVFSSVETEPFAAASIGQVHRAVLKENGKRVCLKIAYPHVEKQFRGDIAMTKAFYKVVLPEQAGAMEEIERQFVNEFDYRREALQMANIRQNMLQCGLIDASHVFVPEPMLKLCTKGLLTMEEVVDGVKLTTALEDDLKGLAAYQKRSVAAMIEEETAANEAALKHGWLRSGPDAASMNNAIASIQAVNRVTSFFNLFRWSVASKRPLIHVPLNHAWLVDQLLVIFGWQVLMNGYFNGDPHPGNILVQRAADGSFKKLALVDFGQVKQFTSEQRLLMARLVVALARADPANAAHQSLVAKLGREMGLVTEKSTDEVQYKLGALSFDRDDKLFTGGDNAQVTLEKLSKIDRTISLPIDFVLASRASFMLRGLGHMLNQPRSVARAWAPIAEMALRNAGENPDSILHPLPAGAPQLKSALGIPAPASTLASLK
jgi:aarF domain-containing kinase